MIIIIINIISCGRDELSHLNYYFGWRKFLVTEATSIRFYGARSVLSGIFLVILTREVNNNLFMYFLVILVFIGIYSFMDYCFWPSHRKFTCVYGSSDHLTNWLSCSVETWFN